MTTTLVISSFVTASRVGATASAFCLRRLGVDAMVLPTTQFGRHPGWGVPGGEPTPPNLLREMWNGVCAQDIRFDGIMTGYLAHIDHIALAVDIIDHVKANTPSLSVLVDPVMGDHGELYVPEQVANAIRDDLLPCADITTPNLWELGYLTKTSPTTAQQAREAARHLPCKAVVTSVPHTDQIGAMYVSREDCALFTHARFDTVPNGGGDTLAAAMFAHLLSGNTPRAAVAASTASVFDILTAAKTDDLGELPLIRCQNALINPTPLTEVTFND